MMSEKKRGWTAADIASQKGRSVIITGTGGLGYETAMALADKGAEVILAGRSAAKGADAVTNIRAAVPSAKIRFEKLDLASLASVEAFGLRMQKQRQSLDILINNAGVMMPPTRKTTKDGFELQFGTNYLGHFALTAHLMPLLRRGNKPRVVHVSSISHRSGRINFEDLQSERLYKAAAAYGQSKIANILFALELQRRSKAAGWGVQSFPVHPGISRTELLLNGAGPNSMMGLMRRFGSFLFQPVAQGALPSLYAATSPDAVDGTYYGPGGFGELRGLPQKAKLAPQALEAHTASKLWEISKQLTHTDFDEIASAKG